MSSTLQPVSGGGRALRSSGGDALAACAPLGRQRSPLRTRRGKVALLHVAVAADVFGDARDLDRERQVRGAERSQQLFDRGAVFADQGALGLALLGAPEDVE